MINTAFFVTACHTL